MPSWMASLTRNISICNDIISTIIAQNHVVFIHYFYSMQTNAFLINEEWAQLFVEMKLHPSISLDGLADFNFHFGKDGNRTSIEHVVKNIALLKQHGIRPGIFSVVTESSYGHASEYFTFLEESGIESAGFCFCYNPRDNCVADPEPLSNYLMECFDIYYHSNRRVRIREFDFALLALYGKGHRGCVHNCRRECGNFLSYTPDGSVCFCDAYEKDTFVVGNLHTQSLAEILQGDSFISTREIYRIPAKGSCRECEWKEICGCGCRRNDFGEGKDRRSYFCETYQHLYRHILKTVLADPRLAEANQHLVIPSSVG